MEPEQLERYIRLKIKLSELTKDFREDTAEIRDELKELKPLVLDQLEGGDIQVNLNGETMTLKRKTRKRGIDRNVIDEAMGEMGVDSEEAMEELEKARKNEAFIDLINGSKKGKKKKNENSD